MPSPRKPRPKRRQGGSRSARRRRHEQAWLTEKLQTRFLRFAELLAENERSEADERTPAPAQEKAPGLAAEGFSSFFREKEG